MNKTLLCALTLTVLLAGCSEKKPTDTPKQPLDTSSGITPPARTETSAAVAPGHLGDTAGGRHAYG